MGSTITAKYPFSGKNQAVIFAEEITVTTGAPLYGKRRVETANPAGTTPNGNFTWKTLGYATGGQTTETRTMEEIGTVRRRNIQQLVETRFECSGTIDLEYQNARALYLALGAYSGLGTLTTAPGIKHTDAVGSVAGLNRHVIWEAENISGTYVDGALLEPMSFNLMDAYTIVGYLQPKIARQYLGCKVDTLALNFTKDGAVKMSLNWKGAQVYTGQSTTVANLLLGDFLAYEEVFPPVFGKMFLQEWDFPTTAGVMTTPTWTSALDTALNNATYQVGELQTASVTISNNLEPLFVVGDTTARAMAAQQRKYEGRVSVAFTDEAQHVKFLGSINNPYEANPSLKGDGAGTVAASVMTDASQTWATNDLAGFYLTTAGVSYLIASNTATAITVVGTPPAGACVYTLNRGFGTWTAPWFAADRQHYYALKLFYDNSSLGYTTASASYRRIEVTLLGVKFKSATTPRNTNGIIVQDFDFTALMMAPGNTTDFVGGVVAFDGIIGETTAVTANSFHSTPTGIT